ncbi:uncharacterized protein A1O9_00369, partial [Exophiala aquamarina CBS 119918]
KGVTIRRYNIMVRSLLQIWKTDIRQGYTILQMLPTHHATGLVLNTIPTILGEAASSSHRQILTPRQSVNVSAWVASSPSSVPPYTSACNSTGTTSYNAWNWHRKRAT